MAKKIRFPLKMNGVDVRTIEELREHFDLESVLGYFANGKLAIWLRDRYYDNEAMSVEELSSDDIKLSMKLCGILQVPYTGENAGVDIETVRRRQEKVTLLRQFSNDESLVAKVDAIAFNQDDLCDVLQSGKEKTIYLCKWRFEIPLSKEKIRYIGLDNPYVILVQNEEDQINHLNFEFINIQRIETSDANIQYMLGCCYANGQGVTKNWDKAVDYFKKSASQGIADSMFALGRFYELHEEWESAIEWYYKARECGVAKANSVLNDLWKH